MTTPRAATPPRLVVDGIIFRLQQLGGISRLFGEILPRLCEHDPTLEVTLLTYAHARPAPAHPRIRRRGLPDLGAFLPVAGVAASLRAAVDDIVRDLWSGSGRGRIWHSSYYTLPGRWKGTQVVTVVDMIYERFAQLFNRPHDDAFRAQKRRCLERADAVICISSATREDLQSFYPVDPAAIHVIPLACQDTFRPLKDGAAAAGSAIASPFLLFVGGRNRHKNFDRLLEAFASWRRRDAVGLVVVGRPWSGEEKRRLSKLGVAERLTCLTAVDDDQLCRLYNRASALVYPSLCEGFGVPLLEAMACGCPVVASRIASTLEVAADCPAYFEPTRTDSLLAALELILAEGRGSARTQAGLQRPRLFSWDRAARQTLEVYRRLRGEA